MTKEEGGEYERDQARNIAERGKPFSGGRHATARKEEGRGKGGLGKKRRMNGVNHCKEMQVR